MIVIGYRRDTGEWVCKEAGGLYRFGSGQLVFTASLPDLTFAVRAQDGRVGPLVGILVSESSIPALLGGRKPWLETVIRSFHANGGITIVSTAAGIGEKTVSGYVFVPALERFVESFTPLPDAVYNRVKSREEEQSEPFQTAAARLAARGIPLVNRSFFRKSDVYDTLRTDRRLWPYLLPTALVDTVDDVRAWLDQYSCIYVKQDSGSRGNGLFRLTALPGAAAICESPRGQKRLRALDELAPLLQSCRYIVQAAADTDTWNGRRYDLRVLAHWQRGRYTITGVGVRLAGTQSLTTHTFHGGTVLPYTEVKERIDEQALGQLIALSGERLSERFGFVGEFSADIGVGRERQLYVYEMNAKPMVFDEPEIETQRLRRLNQLFAELAHLVP
ncbi:YheC/YheD family endospore coat-associated protein [Geobacillus sp. BK01]|uniref:YheC/YheD family endospore coat-associated protein n=1 Tax=Geobacillus sp. BK01 TaxID=3457328 RepID=UPI003FA56BA5